MLARLRLSSGKLCFLIVLVFVVTEFLLISCRENNSANAAENYLADGQHLAKKYCVSCHQLPDPSLIDKKSWEQGVLPAMAKRLHINNYMGQYFSDRQSDLNIVEWQKIVEYYKKNSPVNLTIPNPPANVVKDWAIFSMLKPAIVPDGPSAITSLLAFNPYDQQFYSGDAANNFYRWDKRLNATLIRKMSSPVTGAIFSKNADSTKEVVLTCVGVMAPVDVARGEVIQFRLDGKNKKQVTLADSLPRAVQSVAGDFNKDGLIDYAVCGFGHEQGGLYLLMQQEDHSFKKEVIRGVPGAEQLITGDFNNDGWPDVMCLFAQADEGIWMFLNDHNGGFTTQNLLHFPAVYGSSSFQLVDFNHDGKPDILYTCGDNSDYSKVLKPYHGVYIFINQGNWKFKQTYFYHIDGCTKAIAADFDHDGDLDIATISFFADFKNHSSASFSYLEQTGPNQFLPHELPIDQYGRWLTMEVGDIDHDGNLDIMLGNFATPGRGLVNQKDYTPQWNKHIPVIVLRNKIQKKQANLFISK